MPPKKKKESKDGEQLTRIAIVNGDRQETLCTSRFAGQRALHHFIDANPRSADRNAENHVQL